MRHDFNTFKCYTTIVHNDSIGRDCAVNVMSSLSFDDLMNKIDVEVESHVSCVYILEVGVRVGVLNVWDNVSSQACCY